MHYEFTPPHPCKRSISDKEAQRINWIDWAKAIGIYLVVTGHAHHNHADVVPMIFMIHMPLFFVVSGYLFKTDKSLREITARNIKGLVIPYFLYNIITSIYWLAIGGLKYCLNQPFEWDSCVIQPAINTLHGYSLGSFDGPTWFLLALVWCKYLCWMLHRGNKAVQIVTVAVWGVMLFLRNQTTDLFLFAFDCGMTGFIWFEAGYAVKKYIRVKELSWWIHTILIVVGTLACVCVYGRLGMCNYILSKTNGVVGIAGTAAGLIAFFSMCQMLSNRTPTLVNNVSQASIVIMCLHMPIQSIIQSFIPYQGPEWQTLAVDFMLVMLLTAIYPFIKKHAPLLTGGR